MKIKFTVWEEIKEEWNNRPKEIKIGVVDLIGISMMSLFPILGVLFLLHSIGVIH